MYWFNGNITITMKNGSKLIIGNVPFDANIQTRIDHRLQEEGYTKEDIKWAQYFPSTMDIREI